MRCDGPGLDLAWVAAMALATLPVASGLPGMLTLCTRDGPVHGPGAPRDMPSGCHACVLSRRADDDEGG